MSQNTPAAASVIPGIGKPPLATRLVKAFWTGEASANSQCWRVENLTPWAVWVEREDTVFTLAPFERRFADHGPTEEFGLDRLIARGKLSIERLDARDDRTWIYAIRTMVLVAVAWAVAGLWLPQSA